MNDWKDNGSFLFGTVDMFAAYGIKMTENSIPQDVLLPELRARKQVIPLRSGAYDYGAKYHDERPIQIECVTSRVITREDSREIAYTLSEKKNIRFWTEPDKYYIGRVYQAPTLEQLRNVGNKFQLIFLCEPYAYGRSTEQSFNGLVYTPNYQGTAPTPTYIIIENTGSINAVNIQIKQIIRRS